MIAARHPSHVTLRVRSDIPSLRTVRLVRELERSLRARTLREGFRVVHYSIQSDHIHMLVEATGADSLGRGMKSIAARIARAVNRVFKRRGPVLDGRYHHHVLRTPREVRAALAYVLLNSRKHAAARLRGVVRAFVGLDPATSGRWFNGWAHIIEQPSDEPAVHSPRTWLLQRGWRRHGLIDPNEIPGARAGRRRWTTCPGL
jgi:REP element-mobilizing transposase RayT